jgi:hypothetical protein
MSIFDQATLDRLRGGGDPSRVPIFVLGMPRSGTTLTEQIIASHPEVYGAGELQDLLRIAHRNITGTTDAIVFPDNLRSLDQATLAARGARSMLPDCNSARWMRCTSEKSLLLPT